MASKFKAGMLNFIEVLNQMWDAFAAGPYNSVPLTGGTMAGPLVNTAGVYAGTNTNTLACSSSLRNVLGEGGDGGFHLAATYGVRGIPGAVYNGQWEVVTDCGVSGKWQGHGLTFTASDIDTGAGNIFALQLSGSGAVRVGTNLTAPGVVYAGIENTEQQGVVKMRVANSAVFATCSGVYGNPNSAAIILAVNNGNGRSLNAAGTVNASGADYAEYLVKGLLCGTIAPGQIVGIDADGRLTEKWDLAVSFAVKSTSPCMVGGDTWAAHLGPRPETPEREDDATDEQWAQTLTDVHAAQQAFDAALESARQTVDRIAFAGQVPVNLQGAVPGQFIVPVQDGDGIAGLAVDESAITLQQYMRTVGRVIAIEDDGRARIIVKVA